jgi:hypothetical protein
MVLMLDASLWRRFVGDRPCRLVLAFQVSAVMIAAKIRH